MLLGFRHCCLRTKAIRAATCSQGASFLREEDVQTSKPLNRHKTIQNDHACWRIQHRDAAGHPEAPLWGGAQGGVF